MDKSNLDAIAQAILEPGVRAQDEIRRKRQAKAAQIARNRRIARYALAGSCIGAAVAYFSNTHLFGGFVLGGLAGWIVGWLVIRRVAA
jgi:hypothetical protein